jgi:competence protein ComEA
VEARARLTVTVLVALATVAIALAPASGVAAGQQSPVAAPAAQGKATHPALVDINSASAAQLKTLPWIGDAEAARIIAGRPYGSKASLVTDQVIPAGVYQVIRHRIIAIQHTTAQPPAAPGKPAVRT